MELRKLDAERAMPALLDALDMVGLNSHDVTEFVRAGSLSVLADAEISEDRLYRFREGGFTPGGKCIRGSSLLVSEVQRSSATLARVLLERREFFSYYVHEPLKRPEEVSDGDGPFLTVEGQLLYFREAAFLNADSLAELLSKNSLSWHFLMFCTTNPVRKYERMAELLSYSTCLVCGVYDGESYLVWTESRA